MRVKPSVSVCERMRFYSSGTALLVALVVVDRQEKHHLCSNCSEEPLKRHPTEQSITYDVVRRSVQSLMSFVLGFNVSANAIQTIRFSYPSSLLGVTSATLISRNAWQRSIDSIRCQSSYSSASFSSQLKL